MPRHQTLTTLPLTLLLALSVLLGGCSSEVAKLSPLPDDGVILAFGDSLTYGSGVEGKDSYPAALERLTGRSVINAGVPGELSTQGLQRLPEILDEYRPQLLILCHGGNDILRRHSMDTLEQNLRAMVALARQRGIDVVLVGVPEFSLFLLESSPLYRRVATELKLPVESKILPRLESDKALKSDRIHFNKEGYRQMAEAIYQLIIDGGGL